VALRATVEQEDPAFRQKWCLYVPERAQEPSWLRDYDLFGARVDLTLERVLAAEMGLRSNAGMRELLAGSRGRALAANWETAIGDVQPPIRQEQVVQGLLAVAFGLGPGFSIAQAVLEYVAAPELYGQRLERLGLSQACADQVCSELALGLSILLLRSGQAGEPSGTAEPMAAGLLFSELTVRSGGLGAQEFQALLPRSHERALWARLADQWRENQRLQESFLSWSQALETRYAVRDKLAGLEVLAGVMSFRAVDEALLDELCTRVGSAGQGGYGDSGGDDHPGSDDAGERPGREPPNRQGERRSAGPHPGCQRPRPLDGAPRPPEWSGHRLLQRCQGVCVEGDSSVACEVTPSREGAHAHGR
jgi:hypothetical protein